MFNSPKSNRNSKIFWIVFAIVAILVAIGLIALMKATLGDIKAVEIGVPAMVAYLALVTIIVQIAINHLQWRTMLDGLDQNERGLRQAKDLFDLVERPVITIETADIAQGRDGKRNIYITLVNSGRTIATDVEMQMQTFRREPSANNNDPCPDPAPEWDFADPAGVKARDTVGVNATRVLKADEFSTQQLKDLHERVYELFIRLECKYASASGEKKYKYEWYAKWDPYQVKFSSCQCNNIAT